MAIGLIEKLRLDAQFARMRACLSDFRSNRRGNVAVITALATLPMIAAVGCVIDYTTATMIRTKLQAAADAATLASVSNNASIVATAKAMSGNGTVTGGATYATNFFNANLSRRPRTSATRRCRRRRQSPRPGRRSPPRCPSRPRCRPTSWVCWATAKLRYRAPRRRAYTLPTYINFYLMLDVSGSMSFPSHRDRAGTADGRQSR